LEKVSRTGGSGRNIIELQGSKIGEGGGKGGDKLGDVQKRGTFRHQSSSGARTYAMRAGKKKVGFRGREGKKD